MNKLLLTVATAMLLFSCGESSKKGAWNQEDKDRFNAEMKKIDNELNVLGDKKQAYIDCYYEKVVNNYDNFVEADSDERGCGVLATECASELFE